MCGVGYCLFSCSSADSKIYVAEEPVSTAIKLPENEIISEKAFAYHGISDTACANGPDLASVLKPVIALLRQGAQLCCHNLAHETLVICRELQKRTLARLPSLSGDDACLLLHALHTGHCTSLLAKKRNGNYSRLADEYQRIFAPSTSTPNAHDPGTDAYQCGRLFLHFNHAKVATSTSCDLETSQNKKARRATTLDMFSNRE